MPARPTVVDLQENEQCGVSISWPEVSSGGSPITNYYIAIKTNPENTDEEGNVNMSECGGDVLADRKCFIKCTTLKSDFGLDIDAVIEGKVRAKNAVGFGPWSYFSNDGKVVTLPPNKMTKPRSISKTGDSITITWAELSEAETNGIDVSSYKIGY